MKSWKLTVYNTLHGIFEWIRSDWASYPVRFIIELIDAGTHGDFTLAHIVGRGIHDTAAEEVGKDFKASAAQDLDLRFEQFNEVVG